MIPCRYILVIMIYLSTCFNEMIRANLSMNMVEMVPVASDIAQDKESLHWSPYERALVLGAHLWGSTVGNLIGGPIAEKWSARLMMLLSIIFGGVFTLLSPIAAKHSYLTLIIVRIIMGVFLGVWHPGAHSLIGNWAVPKEKSIYVAALIGGTMGIFFAWILCGFLINSFGWEWGFYPFGLITPFIALLWWFLIHDSPDKHPRISLEEKKYLQNRVKMSKNVKLAAPIGQFFKSIPALSLYILNFGVGWGLYFIITAAPNYIANVLKYDITDTGMLSALVYLARSSVAIICGSLGALCLKKKIVNLTILRKVGTIFSHILPGCALFLMAYDNFPTIYYVVLMAISMGFNGMVTVTSAVNVHDLTANFAGTLSGLTNSCISIAGIITPLATAQMTKADETSMELWHKVFYTAGGVFIFTGVQFIIFGSTKKQPWDEIDAQIEK